MRILKRVLTVVVVSIVFYFLITNLVKNWQKIPFDSLHFHSLNLIISYVFLFLNFLIFVEGWRNIMIKFGHSISFKNAFWIISSSQIAKYVPGGIWFALGRVYLGKSRNLKEENVALSVVVETGLTFLVGILLFLLSVSFVSQKIFANFLYVIPIFFLFLIVLYPPILNRVINFALQILKKPNIKITISYSQILKLSIYFFGLWIAQIIGFYFLINAIYPMPISKIFTLSAAYTLSWMTGFVVIFAPGGLGVREGMMTLLLLPILPAPLAIAISFIARIWITLFEIVIFFVGLLVKKLGN